MIFVNQVIIILIAHQRNEVTKALVNELEEADISPTVLIIKIKIWN